MNLANKLTLLRVILVPFFAFFMLAGNIVPYSYLWAAIIFAAASITDTADGKIARKYNMVTNFGKFLDPLADKLLVVTALICFVELGWASAWVTAIIVAREFVVCQNDSVVLGAFGHQFAYLFGNNGRDAAERFVQQYIGCRTE